MKKKVISLMMSAAMVATLLNLHKGFLPPLKAGNDIVTAIGIGKNVADLIFIGKNTGNILFDFALFLIAQNQRNFRHIRQFSGIYLRRTAGNDNIGIGIFAL